MEPISEEDDSETLSGQLWVNDDLRWCHKIERKEASRLSCCARGLNVVLPAKGAEGVVFEKKTNKKREQQHSEKKDSQCNGSVVVERRLR